MFCYVFAMFCYAGYENAIGGRRLRRGLARISYLVPSRGRRDAAVLVRTDCKTLKA